MPRTQTTGTQQQPSAHDFQDALEAVAQTVGGDTYISILQSREFTEYGPTAKPFHTVPDLWSSETYIAPNDLSRRYAEDPAIEVQRELRPETDRASIAAELKLGPRLSRAALYRLRREFALANHPDLFDPSLRETATQRMTIANMLIDEELQKRN
jgi:hypothetical protein